MEQQPRQTIGDTPVENSKMIGGFLVNQLQSQMVEAPLAPGSPEAMAAVRRVAEALSKKRTIPGQKRKLNTQWRNQAFVD